MGHKYLATVVVAVTAAFVSLHAGSAQATEAAGSAGSIRYMKATGPEFDRFSDNPAWAGWINERFWRMRTYTPYFDGKTGRYSRAWAYRNLYGIATGSTIARDHPEWILRDGAGNKLFIPWGCSGATCPLYAGDFGDPAYRDWWISEAQRTLSKGYKGLWIDDVNLSYRVGDGGGRHVVPIDERAGIPMTETAWRRTMADFLEQIRAALPSHEITHNVIWYAPETESNVSRALRAADYINLERGANDGGLNRGGGTFGFETFLAFVDHMHAEGQGVVFDAYAETDAGREYGLASYFLINNGADGYSNEQASAPDDWWVGFDCTLGDARGVRYVWNGLLRRDFEHGVVLVNQPHSPSVSVQLDNTYLDVHGQPLTSVALGPAAGTVLRTEGAAPPTPAPDAQPSPPTAAPTPWPAPPASAQPEPKPSTKPCPRLCSSSRMALSFTSSRRRHRAVTLSGSAPGARRARISLQRRVGRRWVGTRRVTRDVSSHGSFRVVFANLAPGRYRAGASVVSRGTHTASVRFILQR